MVLLMLLLRNQSQVLDPEIPDKGFMMYVVITTYCRGNNGFKSAIYCIGQKNILNAQLSTLEHCALTAKSDHIATSTIGC